MLFDHVWNCAVYLAFQFSGSPSRVSGPTTSSNSGSTGSRAYIGAVGGKGGGDDDPEEDRPVDYDNRLSSCNDTPGLLEAQSDHHSDSSRVTLVHGLIPPPKQPPGVADLRNDPSDQTLSRELLTPYPTESSKRFPTLLPLSEEDPLNTSGCDRNVSTLPLSLAPPTDLSSTQDECEENVPIAEQVCVCVVLWHDMYTVCVCVCVCVVLWHDMYTVCVCVWCCGMTCILCVCVCVVLWHVYCVCGCVLGEGVLVGVLKCSVCVCCYSSLFDLYFCNRNIIYAYLLRWKLCVPHQALLV